MELSTIFKADIATGLSSVVPTIIIGEQDNPEGNIYLSTKNHSKINTTIPRADYYRPILIQHSIILGNIYYIMRVMVCTIYMHAKYTEFIK